MGVEGPIGPKRGLLVVPHPGHGISYLMDREDNQEEDSTDEPMYDTDVTSDDVRRQMS